MSGEGRVRVRALRARCRLLHPLLCASCVVIRNELQVPCPGGLQRRQEGACKEGGSAGTARRTGLW